MRDLVTFNMDRSVPMLVLSRKSNESLIISHNIEVVILEIRRGSVRIGVKAPRQVSVVRSELYLVNLVDESMMGSDGQIEVTSELAVNSVADNFIDGSSNQILHSFCERLQSGRIPDSSGLPSKPGTECLGAV
jgi:carbon storage regulator